ncbi:hypothetical protein LSTR_LSTR010624 [Laodelphax striatellus]|uniref:BTB domain-containing protein n=1 Tax=Laodelphax striatellus TaxID=195883 RepID=A0A482X546_LAOST|nr:hypothetical protein LSTR_LSTR010624 [Laodelphax striatellus]
MARRLRTELLRAWLDDSRWLADYGQSRIELNEATTTTTENEEEEEEEEEEEGEEEEDEEEEEEEEEEEDEEEEEEEELEEEEEEKETNAVHVEDLEPDGFQGMKKYIYTGETDFKSVFEALATYVAARKYLIEPLKKVCGKHIRDKVILLDINKVDEFSECCKVNSVSIFDVIISNHIKKLVADPENAEYVLR